MWFEFIVALLVLFYIYKTGLSNMSIKKFLNMKFCHFHSYYCIYCYYSL